MERNIKWVDCLDKSGPDKEGVYFITREEPPEKDTYHVAFNLGDEELCAECATYDPTTDEFLTCEDNGCVAIYRSNKDR